MKDKKSRNRYPSPGESAFRAAMARYHKKMDVLKRQISLQLEDDDECRRLGLPGNLPPETRLILGHTMALDQLGNQLPNRKTFQKA